MTKDLIKKEVLAELGAPTIKVEVDDAVWDKVFDTSLRWFRAKKGLVKTWIQPILDGQNCYDMPPGGYQVVDVILPRRSDVASLLSLGFFDVIPVNGLGLGSQGDLTSFYSSYVQLLQTLETRRRVFGADPDWEVINNKILITGGEGSGGVCSSMSVPSSCCPGSAVSGFDSVSGAEFGCDVTFGLGMLIYYKTKNFDVEDLVGRDEDLIYRHVLASIKKILGRIRSKYKSYPSAGGMVDTDGPELLEEARLELEILEEEISESQGAMGFIVG